MTHAIFDRIKIPEVLKMVHLERKAFSEISTFTTGTVWYQTKYSIYEGTANIIRNAYQIIEYMKNNL